jgi:hypothetical protein
MELPQALSLRLRRHDLVLDRAAAGDDQRGVARHVGAAQQGLGDEVHRHGERQGRDRAADMPYTVEERAHGTSKWSFRKLFRFAFDGMTSFSTVRAAGSRR